MDAPTLILGVVSGFVVGALVVWLWLQGRITVAQAEARAAADARDAALQIQAAARESFQALADAALRSNQSTFLDAARSTLDTVKAQLSGDLDKRQATLEGVVRPLSESLNKLEAHVRQLESERQRMFGGLQEQLQALARETGSLSTALRTPQSRGRWGELTLRRVAELAGMVPYCDFLEQEAVEGGARLRPDMTVRLPESRSLAIDAKAPLNAYLDACAAQEEQARRAALQKHAQQVWRHVEHLSSKQYWSQFDPPPDLVVLFLPGDHFFSAALESHPTLIEDALDRRVLVATPVTLISVLKGIGYAWRQERLAENAEEIRKLSAEFFDRLTLFASHYSETGKQLTRAVEAYNRSVGSWETRLQPAVRRLKDLGGASEDNLELEPIDTQPRALRPAEAPIRSGRGATGSLFE